MTSPIVAVGSLGGTITMTGREGAAVQPRLSAEDLMSSLPGLADSVRIRTRTIATKPGASLSGEDVAATLTWARQAVDDGAAGIVLIQGTDTIEESAFLLDLYWDRSEPLVVTGAMRPPGSAGADGPGNLLAATHTATAPQARDRGVLVVLDNTIHDARFVWKARSGRLGAFESSPFGPVGFVEESVVHCAEAPLRAPSFPGSPATAVPSVVLLKTHLGDDGSLVDVVRTSGYAGLVVEALGVGHVPVRVAEAISRALDTLPVVFATRTGSGTTYARTYGFPGSESDLQTRGAIGAGWIHPAKARALLGEMVALGWDRQRIVDGFAERGSVQSCSTV